MLTMLPDIYHNNQANVNRYTSPMKPMGYASVQMGLNHHLVYTFISQVCGNLAFSPKRNTKRQKFYRSLADPGIIPSAMKRHTKNCELKKTSCPRTNFQVRYEEPHPYE